MLQLFLGATNSNKFSFEISISFFLPFKVDQKFGKVLHERDELGKMYSPSSCDKDFIHFCTCAGERLLKMKSNTFRRKL